MMTIKEYAELRGKSVQSVYKQMKSKENASLLEGHILTEKINNKQTKMLDDVAIQVLDEASKQSVQVIMQTNDKERIEELEIENKKLLLKIAELQESLLKEKELIQQLQDDKIKLLEQKKEEEVADKKSWWQFWK